MRFRNSEFYYTYIITNPGKTVLYTGMTNNLKRRLKEHADSKGKPNHFASKYYCFKLLYYETFSTAKEAITREKAIKELSREKKMELIKSENPEMGFIVF